MGFNIVGGTDQQLFENDSGIFVSKIKEDGAAGLDGRLQEGDKILAVIKCWLLSRRWRMCRMIFAHLSVLRRFQIESTLKSFRFRLFRIKHDNKKIRINQSQVLLNNYHMAIKLPNYTTKPQNKTV